MLLLYAVEYALRVTGRSLHGQLVTQWSLLDICIVRTLVTPVSAGVVSVIVTGRHAATDDDGDKDAHEEEEDEDGFSAAESCVYFGVADAKHRTLRLFRVQW